MHLHVLQELDRELQTLVFRLEQNHSEGNSLGAQERKPVLFPLFSTGSDLVISIGRPGNLDALRAVPESDPETWSIGSHKDDIARIEGAPTSIDRLRAAGEEVWHFGASSITFSMETGRVTKWDDSGRLLQH